MRTSVFSNQINPQWQRSRAEPIPSSSVQSPHKAREWVRERAPSWVGVRVHAGSGADSAGSVCIAEARGSIFSSRGRAWGLCRNCFPTESWSRICDPFPNTQIKLLTLLPSPLFTPGACSPHSDPQRGEERCREGWGGLLPGLPEPRYNVPREITARILSEAAMPLPTMITTESRA